MPNSWHPHKPANHTNRDCCVFKQAGKINAKNKDKGLHSNDDEEPRHPNTGDRRNPSQVKTVNMIYATHIPKRERKRALRDVYAMEPVAPKFNHGQLARSPLIVGITLLASVTAAQPH